MRKTYNNSWIQSKADVFWGEIAPGDHVIQIYEREEILIDTISGFVGTGINAGDCCLVIATEEHLTDLHNRLLEHGVHVQTLIDDNRYIPLDAEDTLASFMINDKIDEYLFERTAASIMKKAQKNNRRIRAFGEMVSLLWQQGNKAATIQLESLWNKYVEEGSLCIYCAYPRTAFEVVDTPLIHICSSHSKIITGAVSQMTEVYYQELNYNRAYI